MRNEKKWHSQFLPSLTPEPFAGEGIGMGSHNTWAQCKHPTRFLSLLLMSSASISKVRIQIPSWRGLKHEWHFQKNSRNTIGYNHNKSAYQKEWPYAMNLNWRVFPPPNSSDEVNSPPPPFSVRIPPFAMPGCYISLTTTGEEKNPTFH